MFNSVSSAEYVAEKRFEVMLIQSASLVEN